MKKNSLNGMGLVALISFTALLFVVWEKGEDPDLRLCVSILRNLDGAKLQWAVVHKKGLHDAPTWKELEDMGFHFHCDEACDSYTIGRIVDPPSCPQLKHQEAFLKTDPIWELPAAEREQQVRGLLNTLRPSPPH